MIDLRRTCLVCRQAGVSALPVLDEGGGLIDMYARADITNLAPANAYNRLQWEDVTVGQALALGTVSGGPRMQLGGTHIMLLGDGMRLGPELDTRLLTLF